MESLNLELGVVLLNVSGIFLWGITILYLLKNKKEKDSEEKKQRYLSNNRNFDEEVYAQLVRQQSEKAFKNIHSTIKRERYLLSELIEKGEFKKVRKQVSPKKTRKTKRTSIPANKIKKNRHKANLKDRYSEVIKLADAGMTMNKISEKVKIPKGEIEILIKLRKKRNKVAGSRTRRIQAVS